MQPEVFVFNDGKDLSFHARLGRVSTAGEADLVTRTRCTYILFLSLYHNAINEVPTIAVSATCYDKIGLVQVTHQRPVPESEAFQVDGHPSFPFFFDVKFLDC